MKASKLNPKARASVILLSSLFHINQLCADSCPAPSFAARRAFEAGDIPQSVAVGDFNADGKPDLAVANGSSPGGSVSLLLGRGDGTFHIAVSFAAGAAPHSVAVGDFNGDGNVDLAVANAGGDNVSVLLGRGDGTFQTAADYDVGASPYSVAAGDFNGDGMADLAVANAGAGTISVLLGRGDGTFQTAVNYGVGASPRSVAVGDFNGDGKADLAVANASTFDYRSVPPITYDGNLSVLLGNGDGTFRTAVDYGAGASPNFVVVGDFNGDGKADLAVANAGALEYAGWPRISNDGSVSVLLGNGDGTFHTAANYHAGMFPHSVAAGDFNGDGKADLAVANAGGGNVSVLLGNGDGTFQAAVDYGAGAPSYSVVVGDFNGDAKADLAVANVSVLLGNGDGTFQTSVDYAAGAYLSSVVVGDFNGDGKPDLAVANLGSYSNKFTDGSVSALLGNGDGTYQAGAGVAAGTRSEFLAVGDFNGDGKLDLAVANVGDPYSSPPVSGNVSVLLGKGNGTFETAVSYDAGTNPRSVAVGDFNGDGTLDLVVCSQGIWPNYTNGAVWVLLGKSDGAFHAAVNYGVGDRADPTSVAIADFNGDGKLDLVVASQAACSSNCTPGNLSLLLGKGDGTFSAAVSVSSNRADNYPYSPYSVAVGDFNGDGKPDLVVADYFSYHGIGNVSVLPGNGDGTFQAAIRSDRRGYYQSMTVGDFNGDGKLDLVLLSGSISVLLGDGDGTFQPAASFGIGQNANLGPVSVAVGDLNGDGKPDLAVADDVVVSVLLNTCVSAGIHLGVRRSNALLTLSWPLTSSGFVLESITSLGSTNWQRATQVPMTNSGRLELTAPFDQQGRFFRLHKP